MLLAPFAVHAQCPPLTDAGKSQNPDAQRASAGNSVAAEPQLYDEPQFTVAGVADPTDLGGHGSDTVVRTKEALAKDAVALGRDGKAAPLPATADSRAVFDLARGYAEAGDYNRARTTVRNLLDQEKTGQGLSPQDQAALHHLLGDVEEKLSDPVEAVRQYQLASGLDPSEANLFDWGAELLLHRAPEPAIEVFNKGNHLFPHSARMLTGLGAAWYARGSYDQAAQRLCEASDLNPSDPNPYLFLGKMLAVETAPSEDLAERLERFVRLQPENALANYYYAVSLWKLRKGPDDSENLAQVEWLLQKAVHLDPKLASAHLQLGILYADQKEFPRAIAAYQRAAETDPELAEPHYRLGQAYKRTGRTQRAQQELQMYEQLSKKTQEEVERERREIRQFVYTVQGRAASQPR